MPEPAPSSRLLVLVPAPPSPLTGGGSLRMFHMLRYLGERFPVDVLGAAGEGGHAGARLLADVCEEIELVEPRGGARRLRLGPYERDPALAAAVRRRLASGVYGAVQAEKPAMLPYLAPDLSLPLVLDVWAYGLAGAVRALRHDAGPLTRVRNLVRLVRFGLFDAFAWPATHTILVVSEIDRERCERARPGRRVLVVPNGVDTEAIRPAPPPERDRPIVLFSGDMGFEPNVEAAVLLATEIFPAVRRAHPRAELHLVGRRPTDRVLALRGGGVTVTGQVPDMRPHLGAATVYAAPHFTGAGTRTKLLEAMAAGLPIVTTTVGIEGIEARHDREVLIADDPPSIAAAIARLLAEGGRRAHLGAAARTLAEERYAWPRCLAPLEGLYAGLLASRVRRC